MSSLQRRLLLSFLALTSLSLMLGGVGTWMISTANDALERDQRVFAEIRTLLANVEKTIESDVYALEKGNETLLRITERYISSGETLKRINDDSLARLIALDRVRMAMSNATASGRALLLTLTVKQLARGALDASRDRQSAQLKDAIASLGEERRRYEAIPGPPDDATRKAWRDFVDACDEWQANHGKFMGYIVELEALTDEMIRGGPQYEGTAQAAYDTMLVTGYDAQQRCEKRLDILNNLIVGAVTEAVASTLGDQLRSSEEVAAEARDIAGTIRAAQRSSDELRGSQSMASEALAAAADSVSRARDNFRWQIMFSVIVLGLGLLASIRFARGMSRPIRDLTTHIIRLARGDLSLDVPNTHRKSRDEVGQLANATQNLIQATRDEIGIVNAIAGGDYTTDVSLRSPDDQLGRAVAAMLDTTNRTLSHVNHAVTQVAHGSDDVSRASQSLSEGAVESAAALEEISTSINHVGEQTRDNAENAMEANRLASASRDAANRGYEAVTEVVAAMQEIQTAGAQIANIAKLIDQIAFQTNLLALNASVEAARAGRHGKGFAVVAGEVRNLANRSAKAAGETTGMVKSMVERMAAGSQLVHKTDAELRRIVEATTKVATLFGEITRASHDQSEAITQVASGLRQIDQVIQQNTANAGETARAAEVLSRQAADLASLVACFSLRIDTLAESESEDMTPDAAGDPDRTDWFRPALSEPPAPPDYPSPSKPSLMGPATRVPFAE